MWGEVAARELCEWHLKDNPREPARNKSLWAGVAGPCIHFGNRATKGGGGNAGLGSYLLEL